MISIYPRPVMTLFLLYILTSLHFFFYVGIPDSSDLHDYYFITLQGRGGGLRGRKKEEKNKDDDAYLRFSSFLQISLKSS